MLKLLKNKKGELSFISLLGLLFGSILIVSAVALNSTDNFSINITLNDTLLNISLNESIIVNLSNNSIIDDTTLINESINLTIPIVNETIQNQSVIINETINLTVPIDNLTNISLPKKSLKNLSQIIEKNKNKLNNETESYLKSIENKTEERKYIIKFSKSIDENKLINVTLDKKIDKFKVTKVRGEVEDIEDLIEDNEIEFIELEQEVKVLGDNIPFNIKKVKADSVWNSSKGSGVKVAVLDTGISLHDDLSIASGVSFVDNNYFDSNGHGTSVAGVIAALLNDEGLAGTAPEVSLYSVKIMQTSTGDLSNAIAGIEWSINDSMDIVSMSFGFNSYSQIFKEVLQEAYNNNILLVAASGNEGTDNILYPAKYDTVIAVGAVNENNNLASFSSYGFEQELVAPGVDINLTSLGNSYSVSSGTSLAAPHVAGVAALIKANNKSLINEQIRAKLRNDALDLGATGKDNLFGYGLVQANLQTSNFTIVNLSYFYEIFNISNFGLPNQSYWFWLNGSGTIDDVNFMPRYYLVNITYNNLTKKSRIYNVTENGSIFILGTTIRHDDHYILDGSSPTDGIAWVNDNITVTTVSTTVPTPEGECYWIDGGVSGRLNYCFFDSITHKNECDSDPDITCGTETNCQVTDLINYPREIINYASARTGTSKARVYDDCTTPGSGNEESITPTYYVIDKKRWRCTGSLSYVAEGWYGTNWVTIDTDSCPTGKVCVDSANITTETYSVDPCQNPPPEQICSGTISSIVTDSKNSPLTNVKVYSNSVFNGSVDNDGSRSINYTNVNCGSPQNITIKCSDDTICDTKSSTVDSNGDYDSLSFTCNICVNKTDLSIKSSDISIKYQGNKHNITALVNVEKVTANNVKVDFRGQNLNQQITQNESKIISVTQYINQNVSVLWDINSTDFVSITVDFKNTVAEIDESNNYIKKSTRPPIKAYIEVTTDYSVLEGTIKNFLGQYVNEVTSTQEVNIYVGRKNSNIPKNSEQTADNQKWELKDNLVRFNSKREGLPYNGIIVKDGTNIYVFGNEIDGDISALRKLVDNQEFYFSKSGTDKVDYVAEEDLGGLFVFDYLHTDENQAKYRKNNENFAKVVENVLNSNIYSLAIKRVLTANDNTSLRLKNINAELSPKFKNFSNTRPVVLGHGLFGDLFSMEKLGLKIVTDQKFQGKYVRDTWLIEYSGGPNTECSTCPNYKYGDLITYYWPALIGGVLKYSNNNKIDYVGYSLGGGLGLRSYEKYYQGTSNTMGYYLNSSAEWSPFNLSPNFVEQMALIAPMAAFNGTTRFTSLVDRHGNQTLQRLAGKNHISRQEIVTEALRICNPLELDCQALRVLDDTSNISYAFWSDIVTEVQNKSNPNPKLSSINRLLIMTASFTTNGNDIVVPENDISYIYTNSNATKKYKGRIYSILGHKDLPNEPETYDPLLGRFLNNITYPFFFDKLIYILEED